MLSVTPDTNTLVSATISEGNEYLLLKNGKIGKIKIVTSLAILMEFKEVISRKKFGFSLPQIDAVIGHILSIAEIVMPTIQLQAIKEDPPDNKILECAVSANSDYIVSGDAHLLSLKEFKGIKIVKTTDILDKLNEKG